LGNQQETPGPSDRGSVLRTRRPGLFSKIGRVPQRPNARACSTDSVPSRLKLEGNLGHYLAGLIEGLRPSGSVGRTLRPKARGVRPSSLAGNLVLISYLTSLPLFGSKRLDYFDWCQSVELVEKGNHKTTQALASMKQLKTNMNYNRYFFYMGTPCRLYKP